MTTLAHIIDAMMVSDSPADTGSFGRVEFWHTELGHLDILAITEDDVEDACLRLAKRGKLTAGRKKLAYIAEKMCKEDPALAHLADKITEHSLRKFLQSQAKLGEI